MTIQANAQYSAPLGTSIVIRLLLTHCPGQARCLTRISRSCAIEVLKCRGLLMREANCFIARNVHDPQEFFYFMRVIREITYFTRISLCLLQNDAYVTLGCCMLNLCSRATNYMVCDEWRAEILYSHNLVTLCTFSRNSRSVHELLPFEDDGLAIRSAGTIRCVSDVAVAYYEKTHSATPELLNQYASPKAIFSAFTLLGQVIRHYSHPETHNKKALEAACGAVFRIYDVYAEAAYDCIGSDYLFIRVLRSLVLNPHVGWGRSTSFVMFIGAVIVSHNSTYKDYGVRTLGEIAQCPYIDAYVRKEARRMLSSLYHIYHAEPLGDTVLAVANLTPADFEYSRNARGKPNCHIL